MEAKNEGGAARLNIRRLLAGAALAAFVIAGTLAGFLYAANIRWWPGFVSLSLTSLVAAWLLGAE